MMLYAKSPTLYQVQINEFFVHSETHDRVGTKWAKYRLQSSWAANDQGSHLCCWYLEYGTPLSVILQSRNSKNWSRLRMLKVHRGAQKWKWRYICKLCLKERLYKSRFWILQQSSTCDVLEQFCVEVYIENREKYKSGSLIIIRVAINPHLKSNRHDVNILNEAEFIHANWPFTAKQADLERDDYGDTQSYLPIDENEKLYRSGVFDTRWCIIFSLQYLKCVYSDIGHKILET